MKKLIFGVIILIMLLITYEYQKPILPSSEAINKAVNCLKTPPEEWGISPLNENIEELNDVQTMLIKENGIKGITNHRQWKVTLNFENHHATVTMNAYNGRCLGVTGPLN